eukprot:4565551-Amphidinium_carterae.1
MTSYTTLNFEEFLEFVVDYKAREEKAGAEFFAVVHGNRSQLQSTLPYRSPQNVSNRGLKEKRWNR